MAVKCSECGKLLTDPISMEMEMGPVCRKNRWVDARQKRELNMFGNRAKYSWAILEDDILALTDDGTECRSLTNDLENCLAEVAGELPEGKKLTDYRIMYRDSTHVWDAISITKLDDWRNDLGLLKQYGRQGRDYGCTSIRVDFIPLGRKDMQDARKALAEHATYKHQS